MVKNRRTIRVGDDVRLLDPVKIAHRLRSVRFDAAETPGVVTSLGDTGLRLLVQWPGYPGFWFDRDEVEPVEATVREEQTILGCQIVVDGTPQREMPKTPLRARKPQKELTDTPLFGQERAELEAELDAAQGTLDLEG